MTCCTGRDMRALAMVNTRAWRDYVAIRLDILRPRPVVFREECIARFHAWRRLRHHEVANNRDYADKCFVEGPRYVMWCGPRRSGSSTAHALYAANALCMDDGAYIVIECSGRRTMRQFRELVNILTPAEFWNPNRLLFLIPSTAAAGHVNVPKLYRLICETTFPLYFSLCDRALSARFAMRFPFNGPQIRPLRTYIPLLLPGSNLNAIQLYTCDTAAECITITSGF